MRTSNYGIWETIQNICYVIRSRILIPKSRMIRFPIVIRGKQYIDFGTNLTTGRRCRFEVNGKHNGKRLIIGKNVNIGDDVSIRCADKIVIGNHVLMGSKVLIIDNSHGATHVLQWHGQRAATWRQDANLQTMSQFGSESATRLREAGFASNRASAMAR